jgi:hypothetical protein
MSSAFTMMRRQSQRRYDVQAWVNCNNDFEVKVFDHRHHRVVAHLVEQDTDTIEEGNLYASVFPDERRSCELGDTDTLSLMYFEEIDREAPEHSENTLYWRLDSDSFGWSRHPLRAWKGGLVEGELIGFENKLRDSQLGRAIDGLREEYMEEVEAELSEL